MLRLHHPRPAALTLTALAALAAPTAAQQMLPLGSTVEGRSFGEEPAEYTVSVDQAGFLTVVVRATGGEDLRLIVTDDESQTLSGAESDMDQGGDVGAEQMVVVLPRAGDYKVLVETYSYSGASFVVGGSFLASELVAAEPDPDGKPSGATALVVGSDYNDTIDPASGDGWDWFRVSVDQAGVLTVLTRADEGDLRLEAFRESDFREALEYSDQDQGGVLGNESITLDVTPGETIYLRVGPSYAGAGAHIAYRIASGLIPG